MDLKMQSPQHTFSGGRLVILYKHLVNACRFEIVIVIGFHKIASFIAKYCGGNDFKAFYITCFYCYLSHISSLLMIICLYGCIFLMLPF